MAPPGQPDWCQATVFAVAGCARAECPHLCAEYELQGALCLYEARDYQSPLTTPLSAELYFQCLWGLVAK